MRDPGRRHSAGSWRNACRRTWCRARFIELEQLPLNANGKIDRAALPKPESARPNLGPVVETKTLAQLRLCELWEELLGVAPVGVHDDFFDLGGDSLLAVVMIDRTEEIFGHGITIAGLLGEGDLTIQRFAALAVADSPDMKAPIVPIRKGRGRPSSSSFTATTSQAGSTVANSCAI